MSNTTIRLVTPPSIADARNNIRHVFVRDLVQMCAIGVHDHERGRRQQVRINLDLAVFEGGASDVADDIRNVVCYEDVSNRVRAVCARDHINLVETLAEDIAKECLFSKQVRSVRVRVEKLDVFEDAASVGIEIERFNAEVLP